MLDWDSPNEERGNFRYADTYIEAQGVGSTTVNVSSYSLYVSSYSPRMRSAEIFGMRTRIVQAL